MIGIIGDLHFGVNETEAYLNYQQQSLEYYFEQLKQYDIDLLVLLGDIFDKRNYISLKTLDFIHDKLLPLLAEYDNEQIIMIVGNHDVLNKNTNKINSLKYIFKNQFTIIDNEILIQNNLAFVPWVNQSNRQHIIEQLKQIEPDILFGHLEIANFMVTKNYQSTTNSLPVDLLHAFNLVISGHYHISSQKDNIVYIGSVFQINWLDEGDLKQIAVLNEQTKQIQFIKNKFEFFKKVIIEQQSDISKQNIDEFVDKNVKVILKTKRTIEFEDFINKLEQVVNSLEIIDENLKLAEIETETIEIDNLDDLIITYLSNQYPEKAERLKQLLFKVKQSLEV